MEKTTNKTRFSPLETLFISLVLINGTICLIASAYADFEISSQLDSCFKSATRGFPVFTLMMLCILFLYISFVYYDQWERSHKGHPIKQLARINRWARLLLTCITMFCTTVFSFKSVSESLELLYVQNQIYPEQLLALDSTDYDEKFLAPGTITPLKNIFINKNIDSSNNESPKSPKIGRTPASRFAKTEVMMIPGVFISDYIIIFICSLTISFIITWIANEGLKMIGYLLSVL
ncbi:MAG: hypothetical protein R3D00_10565 [Bacteroidia bacterium]